jgi:hypothetical protein
MSADDGVPPQVGEPGTEDGIPATPVPRESELWLDTPFRLLDSTRYTIGWQRWPDGQGGPGFVTVRRGALGMYKIVNRYPLTGEGWADAWREFAALDVSAAEQVRNVLVQRAKAADLHQPGQVSELPAPSHDAGAEAVGAGERKRWNALTPDEKNTRRQEWRALNPQERKERVNEIAEAAQRERMQKKGVAFYGLGVRVRDGQVYPYPTLGQPALGPAEGARAEITDPTKAQMVRAGLASGVALGAVLGPIALAPGLLRKSKAVAFVACVNGKLHEKKLDGTAAIRAAQRDAVRFNALTGSASAPVLAQPASKPPTPGERLAEVTRLHNEGLLTDEEYQAKRTEIISQL